MGGLFAKNGLIMKFGLPHLGILLLGITFIYSGQAYKDSVDAANDLAGGPIVANIIKWAQTKLGTPYYLGGGCKDPKDGATGIGLLCDCAALTQSAYHYGAHLTIGHTTYPQYDSGPKIPIDQIQPGDLVFPKGSFGEFDPGRPGHVGLYIGEINDPDHKWNAKDTIIEAPHSGDVVKYQHLHDGGYWSNSVVVRPNVLIEALKKQASMFVGGTLAGGVLAGAPNPGLGDIPAQSGSGAECNAANTQQLRALLSSALLRKVKADCVTLATMYASQNHLPVTYFLRQINQESGFNPAALGPLANGGHAEGIGQFMSYRHDNFNHWDPNA
ncbi:MAG: C40 family peptidase, partial [Ktedonobacteraceae bacterium]|nr:C40 family peptidase [Ktedonobacteraceae bacterium]